MTSKLLESDNTVIDLDALLTRRTVTRILWGIFLVSVTVRVAVALYLGDHVDVLPGIFDQVSYDALARRLLGGFGFSFGQNWWPATRAGEPTAHWSFLYTLYIAGVYTLFGAHPLVARLIQAFVVGILHPWLAYRIGRRAFGDTVGLVAAGITALYVYFFYYNGALMTESFYITGILWSFDVAIRLVQMRSTHEPGSGSSGNSRRRRILLWVELGAALGVTVLLRQLFLLFIPFLMLWILWARWRGMGPGAVKSTIAGAVVSGVIVVLMILPWTIRNYQAFDRFVLLNTNAGYAFFWGNHPIYGTNFVGILPSDGPSYYELIPDELLPLDEAALDQALLKRGIGFVVDDPIRYLLLSASRIKEYFKFLPSRQSSAISNIARVGSFGALLPFMLVGLGLSLSRRKQLERSGRWPVVVLMYLFIVVYTGIHLLSWALIRYRVPVDAILVVFAGVSLVDLAAHVGDSSDWGWIAHRKPRP
jgi:hypothetical protein